MAAAHTSKSCARSRQAINDALAIVAGKWKLIIIITLRTAPFRFKELAREIGITPRMLSKELRDLEANRLITRTVLDTRPVTVEYAITPYGHSLAPVLDALRDWGAKHREKIIRGAE